MNLTPEEKLVGRDNYYEAVGVTRRDFMKSVVAAGAVSGAGLGAAYFSYGKVTDPVRVGVIGTGDEGSVLIGAINPEYMQVVAISDIRPSSIHRAFHGDWGGGDPYFTHRIRPGLMQKYDWKTETEARKNVKVYDSNNGGWAELIKDPDVEAIVIATPLHLHHPIAIAAMKAGKHVMSEKLMAHSVGQCKEMAVVSHETGMLMATGHQRHYSVLYDNAKHLLREGLLGELQFIRAQWHRGNLPGRDSWEMPLPGGEKSVKGDLVDKIGGQLKSMLAKKKRMDEAVAAGRGVDGEEYELLERQIAQWTAWDADKGVKAEDHGYEDDTLPNGMKRSALEELV
ncbi:MAG: Gfo/Idh/MocA family oxidoreductase, partial [Planctomycetales bacterium]|nr:Gfo/Idh/MocA family oxidoreductase [Planctomycetales bacterium]